MQLMPRRLVEMTREESLRRLAGVSLGRIVFTEHALPAIRPINHIVDDGAVIVRTRLGAGLRNGKGVVVAYEADDIDPVEHRGWSVIVTGVASLVLDHDELARYEQLLHPWVNGVTGKFIRIEPELVTGYELAE
jgi:hypothetical protein